MSEEQLIATPGAFGETNNFLLERELGRGGMGGVYMGRDKMLDRPVAVKVMLKEYGSDPEFVGKFKREAQAVARLIHPNIAQVYSYGIANGMPYIAMELVAGGSLDGLMKTKGKDIDVPRVMKICEQVAQALRCAADQGLVHGDVKPENILLDANGNAKLVDFGLAAMKNDTEEIWGTPYYIAPEKCKRQPVDYRADMYSLGGTIYHALTGVPPFEGEDANEVVRMRFLGAPKKPSEIRPGLSPQIDNLVMTMLAVEPKDRYPSFEALLEEFKKVMTTGLSMTRPISPAAAAAAGAAAGLGTSKTTTTMKGGKKLTLKKKTFKTHTTSPLPAAGGEGGGEAGSGDVPALPSRFKPPSLDDEDEEEGGNLGAKVLGVVGGVILALVLVGGGLWWFVQHSKDVKLQEEQAQMQGALGKAQSSLKQTRTFAIEYAESFNKVATESMAEAEKVTASVRKLLAPKYSEEILAMLKPAEPAALIAARNELNGVSNAPAEAPAQAAAPTTAAPAPAPAAAQNAALTPQRFRAPTEDEADPASPEGQKYLEEKKAFEEAEAKRIAEAAANPAPAPAPEAAPEVAPQDLPPEIKSVNDLWELAYGVQTRALKIQREVTAFVAEIDKALAVTDMKAAVDLANKLADEYNTITGNPETEKASKDAGKIPSRGKSIVDKATRRLRQIARDEEKVASDKNKRLEVQRKALAAATATLEKAQAEVESVKACFANDCIADLLKYFDWNGMERKLKALPLETPYAENQLAKELRKVDALRISQKTMMDNMKGYTFSRAIRKGQSGIKGGIVESVDSKDIVVLMPGKKHKKISWVQFYRDYHSNLDELIGKFIRGARTGKSRLSHKQWFDAMIGTAYTLSNVCSDDETVGVFVDKLIKDAVIADFRLNSETLEEEAAAEPDITEKDEDVKALMLQVAEVNAKLRALENEILNTPYYRELFPDVNYDELKNKAAEE